jgi:acyl-CoA synthetase (AMP-forming)/AMP-acid ligase II
MWPGLHAASNPDKPAIVMAATGEVVTYREVNDRSNQLAQLFWDAGLRFGDHIAVLMDNNPHYLEVCWAAQRSGLVYTALNWHFNAEEAAYIIDDCDAQAIVVSEGTRALAEQLVDVMPRVTIRLAVGGHIGSGQNGYVDYEDAIAGFDAVPLDEELEGTPMLYSSGTTGRPKGIEYHVERAPIGNAPERLSSMTLVFKFTESSVYLSPAPLYHSAPLFYCMSSLRLGATVVVMEQFDPLLALEYIERYRVTHSQWVPTMFVRMWKLTDEERARYDLSSHQVAIHAAAPCPVDVKRRMIEWWGPIIMEYYSATEGAGATIVMSDEWLAHPGSVGRSMLGPIHIVDETTDKLLPPGEIGVVWFEPLPGRRGFEYHKDADKTRDSMNELGWSTVGDMGYLDDEGYLYLTDRKTFMIVSGGVNIYPQEAENVLVDHPKVLDVAVFGVPNEEMGEEVKAVVQPIDWAEAGPDFERELLEYCRAHLAHYKCPRTIDFDPDLPRQPTGKLYKRLLRDRYWAEHESRIV